MEFHLDRKAAEDLFTDLLQTLVKAEFDTKHATELMSKLLASDAKETAVQFEPEYLAVKTTRDRVRSHVAVFQEMMRFCFPDELE